MRQPKIATFENPEGRMRETAERYAYDKSTKTGTVYFGACPCCGSTRWTTSNVEPKDKLIVVVQEEHDIEYCDACRFVMQRFPELFSWVNNVAATACRHAAEEKEKASEQAPG